MAPVTIIPATFVKVASTGWFDGTRLVCGIRLQGSEGIGECYRVNNVTNVATLIGRTNLLGKDDSISAIIDGPTGHVIVDVSEADPGGAGITCAVRKYVFLNVFPPEPANINSGGQDTGLLVALKALTVGVRNLLNDFIGYINTRL